MGFFGKIFGGSSPSDNDDDGGNVVQLDEQVHKQQLTKLVLKAKNQIDAAGLGGRKFRVGVVIDISMSMDHLFANGTVDQVVDRFLGLGNNFDDDGEIDVWLFGLNAYYAGTVSEGNFHGFTRREITGKHRLEGGTRYGDVIKMVTKKYTEEPGDPAYVGFVTDGDNQDPHIATPAITEASRHPIFWQFMGIGGANFRYLRKLDDMPGRFIDNANLAEVSDIKKIGDDEFYARLMAEFPDWIKEAETKGLITSPQPAV